VSARAASLDFVTRALRAKPVDADQFRLMPVKRKNLAHLRPFGWYWPGVRYPDIASMIKRMVAHYDREEQNP
jgi:hypothetical protein